MVPLGLLPRGLVRNFRNADAAPQRKDNLVTTKSGKFLAFLLAFGPLALVCRQVGVHAAPAPRTLKVKLNYTGAGTVDEKHKIYVLVCDSNPFTAPTLIDATSQSGSPAPAPGVSHILAREGAADKHGTVVFRGLTVSPVYAIAFFDKNGTYNGHPDSTPGAPMGAFEKFPDKLEPITIEAGKTVQLTLAFDDSNSTP
jgi:hypothetical protein